MITAYFDASYNQPKGKSINDPRVHTVAAYLAEQADWRKLRKEWKEALDAYQVPFFHTKDFEYARNVAESGRGQISSKSPYLGWPLERFNQFQNRLHRVINRKRRDGKAYVTSFISNILIQDYLDTLPDDLKEHPECRSYFIVNVVNVMKAIGTWADENSYHDPIHYIFSGGDKEMGDVYKWFDRCFNRQLTKKAYRLAKGFSGINYPTVQWMTDEPALQMVDCPAYEFNRAVVEWAKRGFQPTELRASLSSLCKIDHVGATLRRQELSQVYYDARHNDKILGFKAS